MLTSFIVNYITHFFYNHYCKKKKKINLMKIDCLAKNKIEYSYYSSESNNFQFRLST